MAACAELLMTNGLPPAANPPAGEVSLYISSVSPGKRPAILDELGANIGLSGAEGISQSSPADPTGTTSTTGLMMGLASLWEPFTTGRMFAIITGWIANGTSGDGAKVQIRYGTGTAPANAAALTGTAIGTLITMIAGSNGQKIPFACVAIVPGLTVGQLYWIDVGLAAITGGTASIGAISASIFEI